MNRLIALFCLLAVVPAVALAHEPHPSGAPAHPEGSPDYHAMSVDVSDDEVGLRVVLLQLVQLLQAKLALLLGATDVTEPADDGDLIACTADAFQCSDGSYVGRTGPSCEFICPADDASGIETVGSLTMTTDTNYRYFSSDGMPEYDISSNRYASTPSEQDHDYRVPLNPTMNEEPTFYELPFAFGIALNGVTFEPFAAEWYQDDRDSGWQEDPFVTLRGLDEQNAHVQPNGLYHYHGMPTNLVDGEVDGEHSSVLAFAGDGFPVYGPFLYENAMEADSPVSEFDAQYELRAGTRPSGPGGSYDGTYNEDYEYVAGTDSDLDECNGRYGVTPEYPDGTYYYVVTESFPYVPRCLWGDMDPSFVAGPPQR